MPRILPLSTLVLIGAVLALPARAGAATDAERSLLAADDARWSALAHADLAALEPLLDPALSYVHATGAVQGKADFLAALRSGLLHYVAAQPAERQARLVGTAGLVTGLATVTVELSGRPATVQIRYTATFAREGGAWRLAAYQSTLVPGGAAPAAPATALKP